LPGVGDTKNVERSRIGGKWKREIKGKIIFNIKDWPEGDRPREMLLEKGAGALGDAVERGEAIARDNNYQLVDRLS